MLARSKVALTLGAIATGALLASTEAYAQSEANAVIPLPTTSSVLTEEEAAAAPPRALPLLGRRINGRGDKTPSAYGTAQHPFTTKGAYSSNAAGLPLKFNPFRQTGRTVITFQGGSTSTCSGSVIKKGLIVTAAHCVWAFGWADSGALSVRFEPARFGNDPATRLPFGFWTSTALVVPTVYQDGTDDCIDQPSATGCANDLAIVVLQPNAQGKYPGQVVGIYPISTSPQAFVSFAGMSAAQITQLGYPRKFDSGLKMIRTDSLGYLYDHNQIIIGSDMTQGASGGPWFVNFGINPVSENTAPTFNAPNRMVGITGWGHLADGYWQIKEMGGTRFAKNVHYPTTPNIISLINSACAAYPDRC